MNGQSFKHVSLARALDMLRESTHLSMTVKSNLIGFKEMLIQHDKLQQIGSDTPDSTASTPVGSTNGTIGRFQKRNALSSSGRRSTLNVLPTASGTNPKAAGTTVKTWNSANQNLAKTSMFEKLFTMLRGANNSAEIALATDVTDEVKKF